MNLTVQISKDEAESLCKVLTRIVNGELSVDEKTEDACSVVLRGVRAGLRV